MRQRLLEAGEIETVPPVRLIDCDRDVIEVALAAPRSGFGIYEHYPSLPAKAAALLYAFAKSQACIDGNKRIALIVVIAFLEANGRTLRSDDPEEPADRILWAAESAPDDRDRVIENLTAWLAEAIVPL